MTEKPRRERPSLSGRSIPAISTFRGPVMKSRSSSATSLFDADIDRAIGATDGALAVYPRDLDSGEERHLIRRPSQVVRRRLAHAYEMALISVGVASVAIVCLVCLISVYPPLHDYGEWIYQSYVLNQIAGGGELGIRFKHYPVPNSFTVAALAGLMAVLPPISASQVFVVSYLFVATFICLQLARCGTPRGESVNGVIFILLLVVSVLHGPFWTGEMNYQLGLIVLAAYVCYSERNPTSAAMDMFAALGLFFLHAFCLGIFLLYVTLRNLQDRRLMRAAFSAGPALALVIWYLMARAGAEHDESASGPALHGVLDTLAYKVYTFAKTGPYQNFILADGGDFYTSRKLYYLGCAVNVVFGLSMALLSLQWILSGLRRRRHLPVVITSAVCLAVAVYDPSRIVGVATAGERLIYPAFIFAVMFSGAQLFKMWAAGLSMFVIVPVVGLLMAAPTEPVVYAPMNSATINSPTERTRILFWHRLLHFMPKVLEAQRANRSGSLPTLPLSFRTSVLLDK